MEFLYLQFLFSIVTDHMIGSVIFVWFYLFTSTASYRYCLRFNAAFSFYSEKKLFDFVLITDFSSKDYIHVR